ncbi:MAG: lipopolysaccharide assembly protein LapA domain-containing protein [Desulfuromonadaceae bacterium]|nr:lipopolysaccharide assembly protein LapA domain-containing protein [Desulfuromonadaceae bacterium]
MQRVKISVLLLIGLGVVLIVIQNTAPVQARFLWMTAEVPVVVLLFVTTVGGFVSGLLAALFLKRDQISRSKSSKNKTPMAE